MRRYWERDVFFYAWCDEAHRVDAFAAALSALISPGGLCSVSVHTVGTSEEVHRDRVPADEVIAATRAAFRPGSRVEAGVSTKWRWLSCYGLTLVCCGEEYDRRFPTGPLRVTTSEWKDIFPNILELAAGSRVRSAEVEAAIASMVTQQEAEEILLGLCAPEARAGITTGCMICGTCWGAPIEAGATYHADAAMVARDLALSWVHLHDGDRVGRIAGLSLDALVARVEAAPQGAQVVVAPDVTHVYEHRRLDYAGPKPQDERPTHPGVVRVGPRARLPGDIELTREQVLAALSTPPATLLEALETSAVPDDEWRAVEPLALETLQATKEGSPTYEVNVSTGKHTRFIERHAPYHVRRLPDGGVLLATHPYRTLWQLWADALFLLGIRS
jgi:hypothetical protein